MRTFNITTGRRDEPQEVERVNITIGDSRFRITPEPDGKLRINKVDDSGDWNHGITVNPATGNEILIS